MIYKWKEGSRHIVDAAAAGQELERIRGNTTFFRPRDVVDASRPEKAVLHPEFEWNDVVAAENYREDQARYIIRTVVVYAEDESEPVRAFVSVQTNEGSQYVAVETALSDTDMREQVLEQARADIATFQRKYSRYLDLIEVLAAFSKALTKARRKK
jgi:hypothetical protein